MDYKKMYKEALERARELKKTFDSTGIAGWSEYIFPELKEYDDEKIREALLEYFGEQCDMSDWNGVYGYQVVAWLEKQGEQKAIWHNEDEEPQRGSLILLIMQSGNPIVAKIIEPNHTFNHGERWAYIDDLLEKQGEQEEPQVYETEDGKIITYSETDGYKVVEPKFKVDDWIISNVSHEDYRICKILKIENGEYVIESIYGYQGHNNFEDFDKDYHLWTIQDAKDSDVLCVKYGNDEMPFIFTGKQDDIAYCALNSFGEFVLSMAEWLLHTTVLPATKEQRELLFQKMEEAGYVWDAEKKELKKIHVIDEGKAEMDYCFTKMMNGEKVSSAWSEEDENILEAITYTVKNSGYSHCIGVSIEVMINWLKSLKERMKGE